jgi:hypothetical protein
MDGVKKTYWLTTYTLIFIFVFMLLSQNFWRFWNSDKGETPFQWDVDQYYSYLPATFIHHDLSFKYTPRYWLTIAPNGNMVEKMTCGMAFMYSPFFLLGHKIAINQNSPQTGYSEPYGTCVHYGSLFYCLMGLLILSFVLRRFYSDSITALTIGTIFFATNLFHYTMQLGEMAHSYTFFLISIFTLLTCKWHEKQKSIYFLWLGLTLGLLSLIRPTDILVAVIFIGYGVKSISDFTDKMKRIIFSWKNIPLFLLGFFVFWLPQMIYWKTRTDSFMFFSYGNERFFWSDPQILNFLFSYRKGWFVYTPVMLFSIIGLFFVLKHKSSPFKLPIIICLVLAIYTLSCWWCWWFGGSFGMRSMVEFYALLAIPMAAFFQYVFSVEFKKQFFVFSIRAATVLGLSFFLCLNIIQSYQIDNPKGKPLMHYDSMSKDAYWQIFGKFNLTDEDYGKFQKSLSIPDNEGALKGKRDK